MSGERSITQLEITQSTEESPTGSPSIRPFLTSTWSRPARAAFCRAASIMASVMSMPITRPVSPTCRAAMSRSRPAPEPRSSTVSPARTPAKASGFPQPNEADAASSFPSVSPSR